MDNNKKGKERNYLYKSESTGMLVIDTMKSMVSDVLIYYTIGLNEDDYFGVIIPVWLFNNSKKMDLFPSINLLSLEEINSEETIKKIQTTIDEFISSVIMMVV